MLTALTTAAALTASIAAPAQATQGCEDRYDGWPLPDTVIPGTFDWTANAWSNGQEVWAKVRARCRTNSTYISMIGAVTLTAPSGRSLTAGGNSLRYSILREYKPPYFDNLYSILEGDTTTLPFEKGHWKTCAMFTSGAYVLGGGCTDTNIK